MKKYLIMMWGFLVLVVWQGCANRQVPDQGSDLTTITNPVLPGDHPDPTVIKIGDTYWASATSNEWAPLFPIYKSTDLVNWELVSYVFPEEIPTWASNNFWAPELAYDEEQGKVYMYYTARDKSSKRLAVAVASASSPEGPYTDHGPLVSQELGSIDAYEVTDEEGKIFLLWKEDGNSKGQPTPMWAQEINPSRTALLGEEHQLFVNDAEWEGRLVEGISVFRHDDYYYATYSAGACCEVTCNYKTGVARAKHVLGPWEKYEHNPVLVDNDDWKCSGHGTVVKKGDDFYYLYHAYNRKGSVYVGREGVLEKIVWTADGWPIFANDANYGLNTVDIDYVDQFETLNPVWQWRVNHPADYAVGSSGLLLNASQANDGIGTLLVQSTSSINYETVATIATESTSEHAGASIALVGGAHNGFGAPIAAIGIGVFGTKVKVWNTLGGNTTYLAEADVTHVNGPLLVKLAVSDGHVVDFSWKDTEEWKMVKAAHDAASLVPWGMGFRIGIAAQGDATEQVNIKHFEIKNL